MKTNDAFKLIEFIRESKIGDIFLISFIVLPVFLFAWFKFFNEFCPIPEKWTMWSIISLIIVYAGSIFLVKRHQYKKNKFKKAAIIIKTYIESRNWTKMSFERIKSDINEEYTEKFVREIMKEFPHEFSSVNLKKLKEKKLKEKKKKAENKNGLKIIDKEEKEED